MKNVQDEKYIKKRRLLSLLSLVLFAIVLLLLTWLFVKVLYPYMESTEKFRAFLETFGWKGRLILFGLQVLQVVIALIPGEIIELGAGYAYGALQGVLICLAGVALSSSLIFWLTKKIGTPLVEVFISREKINELRFINSEKKLKRLIFLLFFIPGTPKDVLTYFVGLTNIRLSEFLTISLVARIPSVLTSTICGQMLGVEKYVTALIVYGITGLCSAIGYYVYTRIVRHRKNKQNNL